MSILEEEANALRKSDKEEAFFAHNFHDLESFQKAQLLNKVISKPSKCHTRSGGGILIDAKFQIDSAKFAHREKCDGRHGPQ